MRRIDVVVRSLRGELSWFPTLGLVCVIAALLTLTVEAGASASRHNLRPTGVHGNRFAQFGLGSAPYGRFNRAHGPRGGLGRKLNLRIAVSHGASWSGRRAGANARGRALPVGAEIPSMRTAYSDTYRGRTGGFVDRVFANPVNFRDGAGKMVPINDRLHRVGSWLVNTADSYRVSIPTKLNGNGIRVTRGGQFMLMKMLGAHGAAQAATGNTVRFAGVMPGVSLAYSADPGRVKESIWFTRAAASREFRFAIRVSHGLRVVERGGLGLEVLAAENRVVFSLPMPFLMDTKSGALGHVASRLRKGAGGYLLSLAPSQAWLRARGRHWPVLLDPSVGASTDCTIVGGSLASQNSCSGATDTVGVVNGNPERGLFYFNVANSLPADANVTFAAFNVDITSIANSNYFPTDVFALTHAFTAGATWNTYDGSNSWATPGGDYTNNLHSQLGPGGPVTSTGWWYWDVTSLVGAWVNGTQTNDGLIFKSTSESTSNSFQFVSTWSSDTSDTPYLDVRWWPHSGYPRGETILNTQLTRRLGVGVNVANGNLLIDQQDMHIAGTGMDLNMDHVYNNLLNVDDWQHTGANWSQTGEPYLWLDPLNYIGLADGAYTITNFFPQSTADTWAASPGSDATLCEVGEGSGCPSSVPSGTVYHVGFRDGSSYNFDGNGNLLTMVDKNGDTITANWNSNQLITSLKDTQNRTLSWNRNASTNQVTGMTDATGRNVGYTYDSNDNLASFTDAGGDVTSYSWRNGFPMQITDPNGNKTNFTYDANWRVLSMTRVTNTITGAGDTTTYAYDAPTHPIPQLSNGCPSPSGEIPYGQTVVTDANQHATYYCYDTHDRVYATYDADGNPRSVTYSNDDNVTQFTAPSGANTSILYDTQDRAYQFSEPASGSGQNPASSSAKYDVNPGHPYFPDSSTDAQGNQLSYGYDSATNVTSITDQISSPNKENSEYIDYNGDGSGQACTTITTDTGPKGTIRCVKDANGNETVYGYDTPGNLTSITPPAATNGIGTTTIGYDGLSRPTSIKDANGNTETVAYDNLDQVTKETFGDGSTISYVYDKNGNLTAQVDSVAGASSYSYDAKNRITQEILPGGHVNTYTYDSANNLLTLQDPGGTTTYTYDAENKLCWVLSGTSSNTCPSPPSGAITFGYNSNGQRTSTNYPNGVNIVDSYWPAGQLKTTVATGPRGPIANLAYSYQQGTNDRDLLQALTDSVASKVTCYGYDALDRLTQASTYPGSTCTGTATDNRQYSPDGAGNILTRTINGSPTTYAYNADNELCWAASGTSSNGCASPPSGATTYTYDQNGNETGNSSGLSISYNAKNQTTSITPPGGSATSLAYNGNGQASLTQIGSTTQTNNLLGVGYRTDTASTTYYTRDNDGQILSETLPSGSRYYYVPDARGSVVALTDSSGNTANTYSYDPYGQATSSVGTTSNVWGFGGGLQMPAGFYHFGQRYQDPSTGRWTQQDPLSQTYDLTQADRYTFAGDDPVDQADPAGTSAGYAPSYAADRYEACIRSGHSRAACGGNWSWGSFFDDVCIYGGGASAAAWALRVGGRFLGAFGAACGVYGVVRKATG